MSKEIKNQAASIVNPVFLVSLKHTCFQNYYSLQKLNLKFGFLSIIFIILLLKWWLISLGNFWLFLYHSKEIGNMKKKIIIRRRWKNNLILIVTSLQIYDSLAKFLIIDLLRWFVCCPRKKLSHSICAA